MKKLIIAVAMVCAAAFAQAATATWASGTTYIAASATGGWATGTANTIKNQSVDMLLSVYLIDATTYDSLAGSTQSALYDAYSTKTADVTGHSFNGSVYANLATATDNDAAEGVMYAVVIATYHDATYDKDFYIANTGKTTYNASTKKGSAANLISAQSSQGWQTAAVPEPTSGLLLLLGMAGLALRRRRA